jgi:tetratricopeptide (TPR) repeat protein
MSCFACGSCVPFVSVVAAACILPIPASAQQSDPAVEQHFLAAQQDQQRGLLDAAVQEYKDALRLQPGIPEAYVNLGLVYYAQARFAESAQALTTAAKLRPGMNGVSLWLGIDEVKLDHPAQGAALLREAVRQNPNDKLAQSWLGTALWNAGQTDAALLQLRNAAAQFPDDPDLLFAAGEAYGKAVDQQTEELLEESRGTALSDRIYADSYVQERDWDKAEGHLRRAIERDPHSLDARLELAQVFFAQARLSDAREQLAQAVGLAPHSAAALARMGEVLTLMQQTDKGVSLIGQALSIDRSEALDALGLPIEPSIGQSGSSDASARLFSLCREAVQQLAAEPANEPAQLAALAALDAQAGDSAGAMRALGSVGPDKSASRPAASPIEQAIAALHEHRYNDAEVELLHWIAAHPQDRIARYDLICVRRRIAVEQIFRLIEVAPDSYHVHQLMGQVYADRDQDKKAIDEYLLVAAARPDLPGIHFWLGHLYWKHADADHALPELTRELELDPDNAEADGELGAVLVAEGRFAEAIPHLESALTRDPGLWPAYAQLGKAYASERQFAKAEAVLKRALAHDSDGSVHYQFGKVLQSEGKTAQALQAFAQVRAIKDEKDAVASQGAVDPTEKP